MIPPPPPTELPQGSAVFTPYIPACNLPLVTVGALTILALYLVIVLEARHK